MSVDVLGQVPKLGGVEQLGELLAGDFGTAAKIRLFQAGWSPGPDSVEDDFEAHEADFVGYPAGGVAVTWGSAGLDALGVATAYGSRALFTASDGTAPNSIGGAWLAVETASGPPAVNVAVAFYAFAAPVAMETALAQLSLEPVAQLPDGRGYAILDS